MYFHYIVLAYGDHIRDVVLLQIGCISRMVAKLHGFEVGYFSENTLLLG